MGNRVRQVAGGLVLVAATVAGATGLDAVRQSDAADAKATMPEAGSAPALRADTTPGALSHAFRQATQRALPSVVYVEVQGVRNARIEVPAPFQGTPWEDLFRRSDPTPAPRVGSGSGFVLRSDGYIVTNNHVIEGAERVTVVMQDRREFRARVVGRDPNTDVAVLKVDAENLPALELANSDAIGVGDWVVALGYPLHLGSTATAGIVSAKGRNIGILRRDEEAPAPLEHFIQTDAAINPGNSGGPLVNLEGEVIGINTAIASPTGYYSGYGFAVPINLAQRVAIDLIEHGEVRRPRLGVAIDDVDPADAEVYQLNRPSGVEVVRVEPGTAADKAGIRLGDVVVGIEGTPVESSSDLMERLTRYQPGQTVRLDVIRYGKQLRVAVKLGAFEPTVRTAAQGEVEREDGFSRLGFTATDVTPAIARRLNVDVGHGVVIGRVEARGPAARARLAPGMVIEQLNGQAVENVDDLERAARGIGPGAAISLVVRLPDGTRTIVNYRVPS